jgi:hypothetical protein
MQSKRAEHPDARVSEKTSFPCDRVCGTERDPGVRCIVDVVGRRGAVSVWEGCSVIFNFWVWREVSVGLGG